MPSLYPEQENEVVRAVELARPSLKFVYNWETGCGKSPATIESLKRLGARKALVVCPAMVRQAWLDRFEQWWPDGPVPLAVTMGRDTKTGTKAALAARDEAYRADVQVVSPELLKHVRPTGWDAVVVDEAHMLQSPRSGVSKRALLLHQANEGAHFFGLTATLAPNEPKQVWNLLATVQPGKWGRPTKGGEPNWQFQQRYCLPTVNEHAASGFTYSGVNLETAPELAARIATLSSRLTRYDLRHYLPDCDVSPLYIDRADRRDDMALIREWLDSAAHESSHVGVFTHFRESANQIAVQLGQRYKHVVCITGEESAEVRTRILKHVKGLPSAVLVATMHSVGVGISLTWIRQFLSVEWVTSPGKMLQFLGRFSRLDSTVPSRGQFLVRKGTEQENQAFKVIQKIGAINQLSKAGVSETQLHQLFDRPMTEEAFQAELDALIAGYVDVGLAEGDDD